LDKHSLVIPVIKLFGGKVDEFLSSKSRKAGRSELINNPARQNSPFTRHFSPLLRNYWQHGGRRIDLAASFKRTTTHHLLHFIHEKSTQMGWDHPWPPAIMPCRNRTIPQQCSQKPPGKKVRCTG
jgi:hypothetical protein